MESELTTIVFITTVLQTNFLAYNVLFYKYWLIRNMEIGGKRERLISQRHKLTTVNVTFIGSIPTQGMKYEICSLII